MVGVKENCGVFSGVRLSIGAGGNCEGDECFKCMELLLAAPVVVLELLNCVCCESPGCLGMAKRKVCLAASLRAGANLYAGDCVL